jgi:hypothetical protein
MKTITLPAGTLHLDIDDIADCMARSLWPLRDDDSPGDGLNYGFCYATLKTELAQAIEAKELPARDPLTMGLHAHPYGENVKHARVRVDDLRKYVAERGMLIEVLESEAPAPKATPVVQHAAPAIASEAAAWWQVKHDVFVMAQNIGSRLNSQGKRASNAAIAKEIESAINGIERGKATGRIAPNWDTIRGHLTGWKWKRE